MRKTGLGRGLDALIESAQPQGDVRQLAVGSIAPNPLQPRGRFNAESMRELTDSVREQGILQPILVRQVGHERYELVAGERRLRAAKAAGLATVPALVRALEPRDQLVVAIVENVQREDIGPLEAAAAYRRLADEFGMTQEQIAQRVGRSRPAVANALRLLALPAKVQRSLADGEITEGHARALGMARSAAAAVDALGAVVRRGLSVRETEALTREPRPLRPERVAPRPDPNLEMAAERMGVILGTAVRIVPGRGRAGRIEIDYYGDEDLARIAEMLGAGEP